MEKLAPSNPDQSAAAQRRLTERAQAGDELAFAELYERLKPRLTGYLYNLGASRDQVEDLVQETFTKAYAKLDSYQEQGKGIAAWLHVIARNSYFSAVGRKTPVFTDDIELVGELSGQAITASPENEVVFDTWKQEVFDTMEPYQREVYELYLDHDMAYKDIAEQLDIPSGTVASRMKRGRQAVLASGITARG